MNGQAKPAHSFVGETKYFPGLLGLLANSSAFPIFGGMPAEKLLKILTEKKTLQSEFLQRPVEIDFYLPGPVDDPASLRLLLLNDGQNLEEMKLEALLRELYASQQISPVLVAGIHAGEARKMEYGVAGHPDYLGRGALASAYTEFIRQELLPFIQREYKVPAFRETAFAGFSLGGLSALDIVWNHPELFSIAGIFSGSLWWRSLDQDDPAYEDDQHRIMQQVVRKGEYKKDLRFFFQSGNMDETNDRNKNGIIDSIDDTLDLMTELEKKGYQQQKDIHYLEMPEGKHDIPTWGKAMKPFLLWAFGIRNT
jgi:enterochelin esterase-like enzyme